MRAGIGRSLPRAVVDDGAERIPFGAPDEEADIHLATPFVAQLCGGRRGGGRERGERDQPDCKTSLHVSLPRLLTGFYAGFGTDAPPRQSFRYCIARTWPVISRSPR